MTIIIRRKKRLMSNNNNIRIDELEKSVWSSFKSVEQAIFRLDNRIREERYERRNR